MNINLFIIFFYAAQMYWKDVRSISIPILWPPDHRLNYNHNVFSNKVNVYVNDNQPSAATTTTTTQYAARNRRNENIYKRPNFDFNRLLFNRFNLRQTSDETFDPVDFNDTDEAPSINNAITSTGAGDYDYDNSETGIIATTTTTTTTQTPPIIQQTMNNEWQNINNNNNNLYNNGQIGWRRKRPCVAIPYTNNIGRQQQEENQYNSKSSERTTFNVYYSDDQHPAGVPVPQNDNLSIYNSYGGYICAPNYGNQHHHNRPSRPPRPTRPQHDDNNHNNNSNNNNNNNNGGFFGGLFDFVNSFGSSTSSPSIVAADSGDGTVTPTSTTTAGIVQNAVQNIQQIDWRPFVGGLANTANDIIQIITNTPTQTVRRRVRPGIHSHHHRPNRRFF